MFGFLNIDKPAGMTSRDVVNRVQRLVRPVKVGHAGTLDPLATGVLVVGLGPATRLFDYIQRMPKQYRATFLLGRQSDTEDVQGQVIELADPPQPTGQHVAQALERYRGQIEQMPPAYSALKVQGRRAYQLARSGQQVQLKPRPVTIYELQLLAYDYPELHLDITCSSGTYIRSLGRDVAHDLGTAAVMAALQRTSIGPFRVEEAVALPEISPETLARCLLPASRAVCMLPWIELTDDQVRRVGHGQPIPRPDTHTHSGEVAAHDTGGRLVAILAPTDRSWLRPVRGFPLT